MTHWKMHLQKAVDIVGGQKALGDAIGKSQQYIWNLINDAKVVKAEIAIQIETATDGKVTRAQLRPDIFTEAA